MTKKSKIIYWIATIWLALGMVSTGAGELFKGGFAKPSCHPERS